ncbi:MAG: F0F1 ATP synthase subunit A [Bacilli bacterium]|nr:F0F1 ATP synthase subunit A [Bacilli bacterium]
MNETSAPIIEGLFGIPWLSVNLANVLMIIVTFIVVLVLSILGARNLQMKPTGVQVVMEMILDFVKGIINDTMDWKTGRLFLPLAITLFLFILVGNTLGVITTIIVNDQVWWTSPTADPVITLTLSTTIILLSHYYGLKLRGTKHYFKSYITPVWYLFPIKLVEEFANTLTLGLRLFGNIFAGGVLLTLLVQLTKSGILGFIGGAVPFIVWQGFSIFIGAIQAFIFTMLSMVYISHKVSDH